MVIKRGSIQILEDIGLELVAAARDRNNYDAIHRSETERKAEFDKNVRYYTRLLLNQPNLRASTQGGEFSMSFNMNGTLILGDYGTVYSSINLQFEDLAKQSLEIQRWLEQKYDIRF